MTDNSAEDQAPTREEQEGYLRSRGWRQAGVSGNRWRARNGMLCSFLNALKLQAIYDQEQPSASDVSEDTLRQVRLAAVKTKVASMSKPDRITWLRSRGWHRAGTSANRYRNSYTGMLAPFGEACRIQAARDARDNVSPP
jgi:hypothetical protein